MSFLLEWRRWLTPFAERGLAPFVRPDQLALSQRVLLRCFFDILDPGAGGQAKLVHIECKQCEMIVMQSVSWWWAGAAITRLVHIVDRLHSDRLSRSDRARPRGNVVGAPVAERAARRIGVIDDQREALRSRRRL